MMPQKPSKISVSIADDHQLVRKGFRSLLKSFERIGPIYEAANGKELLDLLSTTPVDVVLLDIRMPVMDNEAAFVRFRRTFPKVKIIVLSMADSRELEEHMFRLSVHGHLSKYANADDIEQAIYDVVDKGSYFNHLAGDVTRNCPDSLPPTPYCLTGRELEILQLICKEITMKEIADRLQISEKTVQNHRSNIMEKLGARNAVGLVMRAIARNLVVVDS